MLAEDNRADVMLIRQALETHAIAHELHVVQDGEQALDFVARLGEPGQLPCPDLVLLDLNLPKADGAQILKELRSHPHCSHVPVIIVTSSGSAKERARVAELGISRYFQKPMDLDEFMQLGAVVREVLEPRS